MLTATIKSLSGLCSSLVIASMITWLSVPTLLIKAETFEVGTDLGGSPILTSKKRALIVGISNYARKGGKDKDGRDLDWWNLHTELDVQLLQDTLASTKFGFDAANIRVLQTPRETTRAAILQALNKLVSDTEPGEIVYFHYSGHGQPAPDRSRPDGMVKTIVPSDYRSQADPGNNIRGDEIGAILDQLKAKKPANITVTFDSCFSYSAVRGDELRSRGGDPLNLVKTSRGPAGNNNENNFLNKVTLPDGYVFLSAASQVQTAKEYYIDGDTKKTVGLFTYALTKAMNTAGPNTTYRDILERVNDIISSIRRDQTPMIEGRTEQKVFDGGIAASERYVNVTTKTTRLSSGTVQKVILQAGMLQGMTKGSKFEIYRAGTKKRYEKGSQEVKPLAVGTVSVTDPTTSELTLAPDTDRASLVEKDEKGEPTRNNRNEIEPMGMLRAARAFEIEHNYTSVLKVAVDDAIKTNAVRGGGEMMANLKLDELAATADPSGKDWNIKIRPPVNCTGASDATQDPNCQAEKDFRGVVLQRPDGSISARVKDDEMMTKNVRGALERESRVYIVRTLGDGSVSSSSADNSLQVRLRIIPVDVEFAEDGKRVTKVVGDRRDTLAQTLTSSLPSLRGGDFVMLEIQNTGTADAYVTVIDLQPDGQIKPAFPHPSVPHDNLIKHGETYRVPYPYVFRLTAPYGQESFRLIATREPTDFSPLLDPEATERVGRGEGDERGGNALRSPLGKILLNAQRGKRGDLSGIPAAWATDSVTFSVLQPH